MICHGRKMLEIEQPNGIRRTELCYSGEMDMFGRLKLKRCIGKSFLDKCQNNDVNISAYTSQEKNINKSFVCPVLSGSTDRSA